MTMLGRSAASVLDQVGYGSGWAWYRAGAWASRGTKVARVGALRAFAAARPDAFPLSFLDVGARGGPSGTWAAATRLGLVRLALVEPDPTEAASLRATWPEARVLEVALGSSTGPRTLHLTAQPGRSSILEPDPEAVARLGRAADYEVVEQVEVALHRFDELAEAAEVRPRCLKVDVQGLELEVLDGFGTLLDDVLGIELEVALQRTYRGQPELGEVNDWLVARGFVPVEVRPLGLTKEGVVDANAYYQRRAVGADGDHDVLRGWRLLNGVSNAAMSHRL